MPAESTPEVDCNSCLAFLHLALNHCFSDASVDWYGDEAFLKLEKLTLPGRE